MLGGLGGGLGWVSGDSGGLGGGSGALCPPQAAGPLLLLLPVRSPAEAVAVAARLPRVGAAAVWGQDGAVAMDTADR